MKKITIDLELMTNFQLSFHQYLVLYHLHTADFQKTEDQYNVFDIDAFENRFMPIGKPGPEAVMVSLKHRKLIDLRQDYSFKCVNKKLFKAARAEKLDEKNIFSFRKENLVGTSNLSPILGNCTKVEKWRSPGFLEAWNVFEFEVRKRDLKKPLNQGMADRLISRLIRLSGNSEPIATMVIQQSNENSWFGFHPLRTTFNAPAKMATDSKIKEWYPPQKSEA